MNEFESILDRFSDADIDRLQKKSPRTFETLWLISMGIPSQKDIVIATKTTSANISVIKTKIMPKLGKEFKDIIFYNRIDAAIELLRTSPNLPYAVVAEIVGYNGPNACSTLYTNIVQKLGSISAVYEKIRLI